MADITNVNRISGHGTWPNCDGKAAKEKLATEKMAKEKTEKEKMAKEKTAEEKTEKEKMATEKTATEETKTEWKRLFLYLGLSFALAWIIFLAFILTGHKWDGTNPKLESFAALGMLTPVIAHVLTRMITKEGFKLSGEDSMMLGISFQNKKWVYFLLAMLLPWLYFEAWHGLVLLFYPGLYDPDMIKNLGSLYDSDMMGSFGIDAKYVLLVPISSIINGTIVSFAAFGEEGGWRGYMMPKLTKLLGIKKAVLIGGIIWGLWHAPLTCVGHNFGTDYPGFPYLGILLMCIFCTLEGILLTFVTVKSGSIWPAAIMHAVNNTNPSVLQLFTNTERALEYMDSTIMVFIIYFIPLTIIGVICLVLLCKEDSKKC